MSRKRKLRKIREKIIRLFVFFSISIGMVMQMGISAAAEGVAEQFGMLWEQLPSEIREELPDGVTSDDPEQLGEAVAKMTTPEYLLTFVKKSVGIELGRSVRLMAKLCGLLVIASVFGALRHAMGNDALSGAVRFCTVTTVFSAIIYTQLEHLEQVSRYFEQMTSLMSGMIPVAGMVWAMGGNVTTATAGTAIFGVFLTVCEGLCAKTVLPLCCFLTAVALCNTLSPDIGIKGMGNAVKKIYTFSLGLIMTVLLASLSAQTTLTAAADSVTARTAKTVAATVIPVVGGSVGETLRTVGASVGYLKGVVGVGGILFVILLILPTLLSLLMTRLAFLLGVGVADLLGCDGESRLLGELGTVFGCMIAVVAMSGVMFIMALTVFVRTAVAVG